MNPMLTHDDLLSFYARQTSFTDPGPSASLYDGLPEDLPGLCQAVQNALLHLFWISEDAAGTSLEKLKNDGRLPCVEFSLGSIAKRLEWLADRNSTPLQVPRKPS